MRMEQNQNPELFFLRGQIKIRIQPGQIIRLQADSNYTRVYFTDHPPVLMAKVLRVYDDLLSPCGFIRTHRSHLVNPDHIRSLDEQGILRMSDMAIVGISRRKRHMLRLRAATNSNALSIKVNHNS